MATRTAIDHPSKAAQTGDAYPYTLKAIGFDAEGNDSITYEGKCAYEAAAGGSPDDFQTEAPVSDRILLPVWVTGIKAKQTVLLVAPNGFAKRFEISDVLPDGYGPNRTLLIVTSE